MSSELVLSVPAGKSYSLNQRHGIYSCPSLYHYQKTKMIVFRTAPPASEMKVIYPIESVVELQPRSDPTTWPVTAPVRERIRTYVSDAEGTGIMRTDGSYRFYFLKLSETIAIEPACRSAHPLPGAAYFELGELRAGKSVVTPEDSRTYQEKLLDERWLTKKELLLDRRNNRCELCGETNGLTIHHGYYRFKTNPWDYEDASLWVLCWPCHEKIQLILTDIHVAIGHTHPRELEALRPKISDIAFEQTHGISVAEAEAILNEERLLDASLYSEYAATIYSSSDLRPSIADELETLATKAFPGIQVFVQHLENNPDGVTTVEGPQPDVAKRIETFLEKARQQRA